MITKAIIEIKCGDKWGIEVGDNYQDPKKNHMPPNAEDIRYGICGL